MTSLNDKESFVCLSCYFVGELSQHGRCTKCDAEGVVSVNAIAKVADEIAEERGVDAETGCPKSNKDKEYIWTEVDSDIVLPIYHNDHIDKCKGKIKLVIDLCNGEPEGLSFECTTCGFLVGGINECVIKKSTSEVDSSQPKEVVEDNNEHEVTS